MSNISRFETYPNIDSLLVESNNGIKIINASSPPSKDSLSENEFNQNSGKINLNRASISIDPVSEWRQMYSEAWRLQRDFFWVKNMSGINWKKSIRDIIN